MNNRLHTTLLIVTSALLTSCSPMSMDEVPSVDLIKEWSDLQPFLIKDESVTGIYRNLDVDSVVFAYRTSIRDPDVFWQELAKNLENTKWKSNPIPNGWHEYERRYDKGDTSPGRPDMSMFSSAEMVRVAFLPAQRKVVVAYVQADSSAEKTAFSKTDESKWAQQVIWPIFDEARRAQ